MKEADFNFQPVAGDSKELLFQKFPELPQLEEKLLSIGGEGVLWETYEEVLSHLPQSGKFVPSKQFFLYRMTANRCFLNCSQIFLQHGMFPDKNEKPATIYMGFALGTADVWTAHAWVQVGRDAMETTHIRKHYFGYPLPHEKAVDFTAAISFPYLLGMHPSEG